MTQLEVPTGFSVAGAELDWPIGSAPGLTNHPDIEIVAQRVEGITSTGVSFAVGGSWTLGEPRGGNAHVWNGSGWDYLGGDEYVDVENQAGYNAKGLPGPGTDRGMERLGDLIDIAQSKNTEFALSLSPHSGEPLEELKEIISLARNALHAGVLYVEINLSCPNVPGRPAFYLDTDGVNQFNELLYIQKPLLNKYGRPGIYPKYGPLGVGQIHPTVHMAPNPNVGGRITSNTLGNQQPGLSGGEPAIRVNEGKAGKSGPVLKELGRTQLSQFAAVQGAVSAEHEELISVLGVDSGAEVKKRLDLGAVAVQLGSVLYWPELIDCESAKEAVEKIKQEFIEAA